MRQRYFRASQLFLPGMENLNKMKIEL